MKTTMPRAALVALCLSAGTRKWIVEAGVQIPVSQNLPGTAPKNDYVFTTSLRLNI